jgi:hypothetical protein
VDSEIRAMQHGGRGNSTSEGSAALAWDIRNLRAFPLFKLLDTAGLQAVEDLLQAHTMQQGTTVFEQGDALSGMFFIVSGQMLASIDGKAVARLGPGDVVGTEVFHAAFKVASPALTSRTYALFSPTRLTLQPLHPLLSTRYCAHHCTWWLSLRFTCAAGL